MPFAVIITNVFVFSILLTTLQIVIRELLNRPAITSRPRLIVWLGRFRWVFATLIAFSLGSLLPWIYFVSFLAILIPLVARYVALRSAEETESLEDVIALVASKDPAAVPAAIERFADGQSLTMRVRCRDFAYRIRSGQLPEDAIRQSALPLGVDSALTMRLGPTVKAEAEAANLNRTRNALESDSTLITNWISWPLMSQLSYLFFLIGLLIFIGTFISLFILPTLVKMMEEFAIVPIIPDSARATFDSIVSITLTILAIWMVLTLLSAITGSRILLRITPWFGEWLRTRNRHRGLRAIAAGVALGRPISEVLELSRRTSPARWIRSRSKMAYNQVVAGQDIGLALKRSGWLSGAEAAWVNSAIASGTLPETLDWIAVSIRRRYELKWKVRIAWLVPLVLVLIGAMVAALAYYMFGSLVQLIYTLT